MGQPDPSWMTLGDEPEEWSDFDDFDRDHEDDGLYVPDVEEC